jgi:hypothetical protein
MRLIMFDPSASQKGDETKQMRKSASVSKLEKFRSGERLGVPQAKKANLMGSMHEHLTTDIDIDRGSSRIGDDLRFSEVAHKELDLDYMDELELNRAFSVFKDI